MEDFDIMAKIKEYGNLALDSVVTHAPKIIIGLVILWIGMKVINRLMKMIAKLFEKNSMDGDLKSFLISLFSAILKVVLVMMCADIIGLPITSFVGILAAAAFAVGMALQGSLANFAAGVMILLFKPYKTGDLVELAGSLGTVQEVQIFNTILTGVDQKRFIVPNGAAISGTITNLSAEEFLRVDLTVNVPYSEDFDKVEKIILDAMNATPKVLKDPAAYVGIASYDSHYLVVAMRPHATVEDYWDVYFNVNRNVKKALSENGIKVAYTEGMQLGEIGR